MQIKFVEPKLLIVSQQDSSDNPQSVTLRIVELNMSWEDGTLSISDGEIVELEGPYRCTSENGARYYVNEYGNITVSDCTEDAVPYCVNDWERMAAHHKTR